MFHQSGQPPRLNVNTRAHLQQLLPLVELPATTDARGRRTKYSLKALMKAAPALAQVGRPAWVARVKESADVADASKLSGAPFETPQQRAPVCPGCEAPLSMILQLNPADLPKAVGARLPGLVAA